MTLVHVNVPVTYAYAAKEDGWTATGNLALFLLASLSQASVIDILSDAPGGESEGDVYLVSASPSGTFAAQANKVALYYSGSYIFVTPKEGWAVHVNDENVVYKFDGSAWAQRGAAELAVSDSGGFTANTNVESVLAEILPATPQISLISDPGDTGAIPVSRSGNCALTSGIGAETRTVADPGSVGLRLTVTGDEIDVLGPVTITVANPIDQTGNDTILIDADGEYIALESVQVGSSLRWRVAAVDGATLS